MKESFIEYLEAKGPDNSGKPTSYARAMKVIEEVFFSKGLLGLVDIWSFITLENIDPIYEVVLNEQAKNDGIFQNYKPSSYWKKRYCSAALKEFKLFL